MVARTFRFRARLRVENRSLARLLGNVSMAALVAPPFVGLLVALVDVHGPDWLVAAYISLWVTGWLVISPLAFFGSVLAGRSWSRSRPCFVDVDESGIVADGGARGRWARDAIESATALVHPGATALEIVPRRGACVVFEPSSDTDAREALDALDLGVRNQRVVVPFGARPATALAAALAAGIGAFILTALIGAFTNFPGVAFLLALLLPVLVPALVYRAVVGGRVVVGSDGVRIVAPFRTTFVPAHVIASATARDGLRIARDDGTSIHIGNIEGAHIVACLERIDALAGAKPAAGALLDRGERSVSEWRAALATVSAAGGYREASLGVDALVDVATSPGPLDRRLGAAIALARADDATRTRVRVAASALAGERARIAMESAIDGDVDDEVLERAFREAR